MSTYLHKTRALLAAALLALAMGFGLAITQQAYADEGGDQAKAALEQGYYRATAESSSSMVPLVGENHFVYVDAEGNACLLVFVQNNQGKYDYMWKGTQAEGKAKVGEDGTVAVTEDMYWGIPVPAEPGFTGAVWLDDAGHYGVANATYKALLFFIPLTPEELAAGQINFLIRRSPWTPLSKEDPEGATKSSNAEKWMGTKDNTLSFTIGAKVETDANDQTLPAAADIQLVTSLVGAVPEDATADDLPVYIEARDAYQEFTGMYSCVADASMNEKYAPYSEANKLFMDTVIPEAQALLDAALASIPNVVPADGTYSFLANIPTGTSLGVNESHIANGRIPSATLVVKDGKMQLTVKLTSSSYDYTYVGTPAEAAALEAAAIAKGGSIADVEGFMKPDENNCITFDIASLEKPVYLTWHSKSSKVWFVRGSVFHQFNMGTEAVIALANEVNALMNDPLGKAEGDVKDKAFRIDPWTVSDENREGIQAADTKYAALSDADKAAFDELAVYGTYANEVPYGQVLKEAVWGLAALDQVHDAAALPDGDYGAKATATFDNNLKGEDAVWSLAGLKVKDGKATATIQNTSGEFSKVKVGGQEIANATPGAKTSTFEIPVALNEQMAFVGLTQMTASNEVAYETGVAFQLKIDFNPTVVSLPTAASGLKYTGKELVGVAAGEGYTVADGSAINAGAYTATATLAEGCIWADGTSDAKSVPWSIAKASQTIKAAKATYKVKFAQVKKKAVTVAVAFNASGGGKVTYAAAKSGKVSIAKNGKVTVKKGAKKGTYTLSVKATAADSGNYAQTTQTVKLKVKVA